MKKFSFNSSSKKVSLSNYGMMLNTFGNKVDKAYPGFNEMLFNMGYKTRTSINNSVLIKGFFASNVDRFVYAGMLSYIIDNCVDLNSFEGELVRNFLKG